MKRHNPEEADAKKLAKYVESRAFVRWSEMRRIAGQGAVQHFINHYPLNRITSGLYENLNVEKNEKETLARVCAEDPKSIACLTTAANFYGLTTAMPRTLWMLIPMKARASQVDGVPIHWIRGRQQAVTVGIEKHIVSGIEVKVTSPARTVVDIWRHKTMDEQTKIEALDDYLDQDYSLKSLVTTAREFIGTRRLLLELTERFRDDKALRQPGP